MRADRDTAERFADIDVPEDPTRDRDHASPLSRPLLGVIRWDMYSGHPDVTQQQEFQHFLEANAPSLGSPFLWRAPFFARKSSATTLWFNSDDPQSFPTPTHLKRISAAVEKEIEYASTAGIDYWAFGFSHTRGDSLRLGLDAYLKSSHKLDLNFCLIIPVSKLFLDDNHSSTEWRTRWDSYVGETVAFMKEPSYQTVGGGRPLIYLFGVEELSARLGDSGGSHAQLSAAVSWLRQCATKEGLKDPFVVGKAGGDLSAAADVQLNKAYVAAGILDSVHPYHYRSGGGDQPPGQPYTGLWSAIAKNYLQRTLTASLPVLPPLMSGANWAPRAAYSPGTFKGRYWTEPDPAAHELEQHLWGGLDWITAHEASSPGRSVLMYAWNEHSEGGFVCPLMNPADYDQPDTKRLDAVSRATKTWVHPQSRDRDGPVVASFSFGDREPSRAAITMEPAVTASELNVPAGATIVAGNNLRTARRGHSLTLSSGQEVSFSLTASAPRRLNRVSLALRTESRASPCEVSFFLESLSGKRTPLGSHVAAQSSRWQEISLGVPTGSQALSSSVKIAVRVLQTGAAAGRLYLDDLQVQSRAAP